MSNSHAKWLRSADTHSDFGSPDWCKARCDAAADEIERLSEALEGVIDWADFALSNPQEFDCHGVKNLDGPAFEKAREALFQETS